MAQEKVTDLFGLWGYLMTGWSGNPIFYNDLRGSRRSAHMHSYMTQVDSEAMKEALSAGLELNLFTVPELEGHFSEWLGNPNCRQPTDQWALTTLALWLAFAPKVEAKGVL